MLIKFFVIEHIIKFRILEDNFKFLQQPNFFAKIGQKWAINLYLILHFLFSGKKSTIEKTLSFASFYWFKKWKRSYHGLAFSRIFMVLFLNSTFSIK